MNRRLTPEMIAAARATDAGRYLDELIAADVKITGGRSVGGSVIEQLWHAMINAQQSEPKRCR